MESFAPNHARGPAFILEHGDPDGIDLAHSVWPNPTFSTGAADERFSSILRLPRPMQLHLVEPHLHAIGFGTVRHGPFGRKQRQLTVMSAVFVEGLDDPTPGVLFFLARWLSLISPRYNTGRCTTLPPVQRLLSTMLQ